MTFAKKRLSFVFRLGTGDFGEGGFDTVSVTDRRASVDVTKLGGGAQNAAKIQIFGLPETVTQKLSTFGMMPLTVRRNTVSIFAGDPGKQALVFEGTIISAWLDPSAAPDTVFNIEAGEGLFEAVRPVPPSSFLGPTDAAVVMASIANQMNKAFENNGVSVFLANPYFPGTAYTQADACAKAGGFRWILDGGTLAIWPKNGVRGGPAVGVIPVNPQAGMVAYPSFSAVGMSLTVLFDPAITFGGRIMVTSQIKQARGEWRVLGMRHSLQSEVPGGAWFTQINAVPPGFAPI